MKSKTQKEKDFTRIRSSAKRIKMNEDKAYRLIEKIRSELSINK